MIACRMHMYESMDGWMDGRTDGRDGRLAKWMDKWVDSIRQLQMDER